MPKILEQGVVINPTGLKELGDYPWNYLVGARSIADALVALFVRLQPDMIIIEETNKARNRYSQKILEFIHCYVLQGLQLAFVQTGKFPQVGYINSSDWRKVLGQHMSKTDKAQNVKVKRLKRSGSEAAKAQLKAEGLRGKITKKHLAIRWANQTFGLELRPKDDDIADALSLGTSWFMGAGLCDGTNEGSNVVKG